MLRVMLRVFAPSILAPVLLAVVGLVAVPSLDAADPPAPDSPEFRARVLELVEKLGDPKFVERERATDELRRIGVSARALLEQAAQREDREIAQRAAAILNGFPKLTHVVVDAFGAPIPFAKVVVTIAHRDPMRQAPQHQPPASGHLSRESAASDERGRIPVGEFMSNEYQAWVQLEHPDYGSARSEVDLVSPQKSILLPLVKRGGEAYERAARGRILSADGRPVAGAVIQCNSVRTAGEGLVNGTYPRGDAISDAEGRFVYYLPNDNAQRQRGDLIPPASRYELAIEPPDDEHFPTAGFFPVAAPLEIRLDRPQKVRRFRWEAANGGFLDKPEQLRNLFVNYLQTRENEQRWIRLDAATLARGRRTLDGSYQATFVDNGKSIQFAPLVVSADSPEELVFRLPPELTFRGVVRHGVTRAPAAGVLVMGWNSTSRNNLALLTPEEWKTLGEAPANPPPDHPAAKLLARHYGLQALARTDAEGRFEIVQRRDQQFYGLLAFAEDYVPFRVVVGSQPRDAMNRSDVGEIPLFPAAKVLVRPMTEPGKNVSAMLRWQPADGAQPAWIDQFRAIQTGSMRDFETQHWLALNEAQPVYVPADLRLKLQVDAPYNDEWTPSAIEPIVQLPRGGSRDLGDVTFAPSLAVVVRVVRKDGAPVEGFAVRKFIPAQNAWGVARNTDKDGRASFHVQRRSTGQLRVSDLSGPTDVVQAKNLSVEYRVEETAPEQPFVIEVTDEQVALLRGGK